MSYIVTAKVFANTGLFTRSLQECVEYCSIADREQGPYTRPTHLPPRPVPE